MMKKRIAMSVMALVVMAFCAVPVMGEMKDVINFTPEQITALAQTVDEHNEAMHGIISKLETTAAEMMREAIKDEGESIPKKQRKDQKKVDKLIREIASLTGDILKEKTRFLLKSKNVLTQEQKKALIADLEYDVDFFDNGSTFLFQLDDLAYVLDLSTDQVKTILELRADMKIKDIKMKLEVAKLLLDIRDFIDAAEKKGDSVDEKVMKIADYGAKLLNNRVDYILKARKVLTPPQKQELRQLIMMNLEAFSLFN